MDTKISALTAAFVYTLLCAPGLFAQPANQPPGARAAPDSQQAQATTEASDSDARENDQEFVLGLGFGGHAFKTPHHAGQQTQLIVNSALMLQFYGEWYVLDTLGVGLRLTGFGETVTSTTTVTIGPSTFEAANEVDVGVHAWLFTLNWVPLGGREYARMGVVGGLGRASYEFTETNNPGPSFSSATSGPAALVGIYLDWGADGFGGRFGTQYLATDLDAVDGTAVDVSGRDIYFDMRWAF